MKLNTTFLLFFIMFPILMSCNGQTRNTSNNAQANQNKKPVGGGCDGCELMFTGMPAYIDHTDTSLGWHEAGQKLLVTGTVFKIDRTTPAADVVIYYWQTDNNGLYTPIEGMDEKAKRHGHIRGWVKTGADGKYYIYTIKPAPYPSRDMPAHIHFSIKEPNIQNEYYIDDLVFDDDPLLTKENRNHLTNRGGNGIVKPKAEVNYLKAERNIILGMNIPHYPLPATKTSSNSN